MRSPDSGLRHRWLSSYQPKNTWRRRDVTMGSVPISPTESREAISALSRGSRDDRSAPTGTSFCTTDNVVVREGHSANGRLPECLGRESRFSCQAPVDGASTDRWTLGGGGPRLRRRRLGVLRFITRLWRDNVLDSRAAERCFLSSVELSLDCCSSLHGSANRRAPQTASRSGL